MVELFETIRPKPLSPRVMVVKEINVITACNLNKLWHSRLPKIDWSNVVRNRHYICFGALYYGEWFAVGIWSSPVAGNRLNDNGGILELRRFAIAPDAPKYTASWMIAKMIKQIKITLPMICRLISYQDTEVHLGTIYKASNWFVGGKSKGISWSNPKRQRNKEQSLADKIRWEYIIL